MHKREFILMLGCYGILLLSKKLGIFFPPLINSYISDFLCLPIALTIIVWTIRWIKNDREIQLSLPMIITTFVLFSVVFEYYLPAQSDVYTADPIDIGMYALGGAYFCQRQHQYQRSIQ